MPILSESGQRAVDDIARRTGFSPEAVAVMLEAVLAGNGGMAQFNHPEFGGAGQWMRRGMTMIGDMFNGALQGRVAGLCEELATLVAGQHGQIATGSFQSQSQGYQPQASHPGSHRQIASDLFVPSRSGTWWPEALGLPTSVGAQNDTRYAYFADPRRLAISIGGRTTVYDTLDHQIGGFSQQQGGGGSMMFTSQHGLVDTALLPVVFADAPSARNAPGSNSLPSGPPRSGPVEVVDTDPERVTTRSVSGARSGDVFAAIEKLADLRSKGILSDDEFTAKKAELLARL